MKRTASDYLYEIKRSLKLSGLSQRLALSITMALTVIYFTISLIVFLSKEGLNFLYADNEVYMNSLFRAIAAYLFVYVVVYQFGSCILNDLITTIKVIIATLRVRKLEKLIEDTQVYNITNVDDFMIKLYKARRINRDNYLELNSDTLKIVKDTINKLVKNDKELTNNYRNIEIKQECLAEHITDYYINAVNDSRVFGYITDRREMRRKIALKNRKKIGRDIVWES